MAPPLVVGVERDAFGASLRRLKVPMGIELRESLLMSV